MDKGGVGYKPVHGARMLEANRRRGEEAKVAEAKVAPATMAEVEAKCTTSRVASIWIASELTGPPQHMHQFRPRSSTGENWPGGELATFY